jgi:hypothetical protein
MKIVATVLLLLSLCACAEQGTFERAGEDIDDAVDDVREGVEDVEDAVDDVRDDRRRRR